MKVKHPMRFTPLEEYAALFANVKFSRADGVLTAQLHTDGAELVWTLDAHREISHLWNYVGLDPENKIIILTGTGSSFLDRADYGETLADLDAAGWLLVQQDAKKIINDLVEIEQPIIAALNGPSHIHSQIPMLCDIVLATPETTIGETHFPGVLPGDGHHIVWPLLLGLNRAKYMLLTGGSMAAAEAKDAGVVSEIVPSKDLLPRAQAIARQILTMNPLAVRQFRPLMMQPLKRALVDGLHAGLLAEGYGLLRALE